MKTTTIRMLGKGLTALCLLLLSHVGFAQTAGTAVTYTFNNFTETSANSFEYDLWVTNTGTTALNAKAFSFGLNCTANIGTLTHTYVPGSKDPAFNVITTYTVASAIKGTAPNQYYHLRLTTNNATAGSEPLLVTNVPYKVGRFKVQSTLNWAPALNPFLPPAAVNVMQLTTLSGYTQAVVNALVNGSATAYSLFGTANAPTSTSLNVLTASMSPSPTGPAPFLLNNSCTNTTTSLNATACDSYTWADNGQTYTASGTYTYTSLIGAGPCFNTATLNLTVNYSSSSSESATACDSYTWAANGQTYNASGTYTSTSLNASGCTHTATLSLTINNSTSSSETASACGSYTWAANGQTYNASGTYTATSLNAAGCTHTTTLNLTIGNNSSSTDNITACDSYTWAANGQSYNASGTYTATSLNASGCVHTSTLNLTINNSTSSSESATACDSYTWAANGQTYNASGTYTATSLNAAGCTHTTTLNLTINSSTSSSESATACDSYTWAANGQTYNASGTYTATSMNAAGCTHTATLNLTINNSTSSTENATACDSYTWAANGQTYNASGTYTATSTNAAGCLHTTTLNLVVNYSSSSSESATACDSYTWAANGQTYNASGSYTATSMNASGCTHTSNLSLTINNSTSSSETASACDSYTWAANGQTYTASGSYTATSMNAAGCTHTTTLSLTIVPSTTLTSSASACDSYTWSSNGQTYTASGTYTYQNGCGTEVLNLTITPSTSNSSSAAACDSYTWSVNNQTYTASGTYTSVSGCNTDVLNLTITPSTSNTTNATACDSYTWSVNSVTYTASGTYTSVSGCHTEILNVTVTPSTTGLGSATACDSYTWSANGTTYTASGSYASVNGCHTDVLALTVNYSSTSSESATACDSYTWAANGQTYNASGTYTATSMNAGGCVHTATLNLTINNSTSSSSSAAACDSYTWNGTVYTASGTYTATSMNAAGCVHTETLNLTITPSTNNVTNATACDSYTWSVNSVTYTASGSWSVTSGCHTETLNLTINNSSSNSSTVTAAGSYTWAANGQTYFASGTYTATSLNAAGCTHTETLVLIITGGGCSFTIDSLSLDQPVSCFGNNDAAVQAYVSPSGSYTYTIVHPDLSSASNNSGYFNGLTPGTHTVYVSDGTCTSSTTITITQPDPLDITFITTDMVSCAGNDGTLSVIITGGTNVLQGYLTWWTNSLGDTLNDVLTDNFALSVDSLGAGVYNVAIEDDHGCFYNESGSILAADPIVPAGNYAPIVCNNGSTVLNVSGTGGYMNLDSVSSNAPFVPYYSSTLQFSVNGSAFSNQTAYNVSAGTYTIVAMDSKGCTGSVVVTIANPAVITGSSSATACDSYSWNGTTYTTSGSYTGTFMAANGCDSVHTLNLTINYSTSTVQNETACDTYTWSVNGVTYTTSGTYTFVGTNTSGCPDTYTLNLTINYSSSSTENATACDSYTWSANGMTYTASGSYTATSLNAAGCVHTTTLNLTINNSTSSTDNITACDSYTWAANGMTYTASGTYTATYLNAAGCPHSATLNLTVNYSTSSSSSYVWCDMYTWYGTTYTASGTYTHTSLNAAGCTHTETLNLTLGYTQVINDCCVTACDSYTWTNGVTYTASGTYYYITQNPTTGCAIVHTMCLTLYQSTTSTSSATACDSYTWAANGMTYTASGTYTATSLNAAGCTHTSVLNLTINNSTSSTSSATACDSYMWAANGMTYTASGTYTATWLNAAGCTHTETLNLTVNYSSSNSSSATACDSYTWAANGMTYTTSGTYTATWLNASGCTHTETLNLTVNYSSAHTTQATACDSYTWTCNGATYTATGMYTCTYLNASGCTHTETLDLTVNYSSSSTESATACDSYTWACNGATYTTSGTYTCTYLNQSGCVHTTTLNLTVNYSSAHTTQVTACDSYTWTCNGATYTASGMYTCTYLNASGCVHTETLDLTVNYSTSSTANETACDSYTWAVNGVTYTTSGTYTFVGTNTSGCPHTYTLNLTINYSTSSTDNITACDSYSWSASGMTYTTSGTYTATSMNAAGCTHTSTLNLTVNYSSAHTTQVTACDSYTWSCNGATYTATGMYTCTYLNASGCTHTETLDLTVNYSSAHTTQATACDSYTWSCNGATYTATGMYTCTYLNASGCTHTETLDLTVNYSSAHTTQATACDSYTWSCNGATYTATGMYTCTYLNTSGCVHTETLDLTVNYSSAHTTQATACDSYTWSCNGATYTATGMYTCTYLNASGCTHTETLDLTVNYSSAHTTQATACDSYTWSCNGATYTATGMYTCTYLNASGCTHTETLDLTVNYSSAHTTQATACDSYTWSCNGATYTATGMYTCTYLNTSGCVHTETLDLTVNYSSAHTTQATACDSYTWSCNGATYTATGMYTCTYLNASGCTHTETLDLTVNYSSAHTTQATACDSYTWSCNGATYTATGMYTCTYLNASGCTHTETLDLTVNYSSSSSESATACDSYTWACNGMTYTTSGTYTCTYLNQSGCVHTTTLNLTVNYSTFFGNATTTQCNSYTWNGTTYTASGIYTFTSMNTAGCVNTATLDLTINYGSTGSSNVIACNSYTWNGVTYTASGTYTATFLNAAGCDSVHTLVLTLNNGVYVSPKVLLSGAYVSGGMMRDDLRSTGVLQNTEPYTALSFANVGASGYVGGETFAPAMLAVTGNDAIVDWVHVEIRTGAPGYSIVATANGLVQRDGDVVDVNGNPLYFPTVCPGNYHVTVKHRNHLGVMTASTLSLTSTNQVVDFTTSAPVWTKPGVSNAARKVETDGARTLWAGDTRTDKNVKYNGINNDKEPIIYAVGIATPNNILYPVYRAEDANMDARVKYNNSDNDKNYILSEILNSNAPISTPNDILSQHTPN